MLVMLDLNIVKAYTQSQYTKKHIYNIISAVVYFTATLWPHLAGEGRTKAAPDKGGYKSSSI